MNVLLLPTIVIALTLHLYSAAKWKTHYGCVVLASDFTVTVFPRLERARSINFRLAPRGVVFEGAL